VDLEKLVQNQHCVDLVGCGADLLGCGGNAVLRATVAQGRLT